MNAYLTYGIIFVILLALELCYFKVADDLYDWNGGLDETK